MENVSKMDMLANCEDIFRHARWSEQKTSLLYMNVEF